ncbi:MAG: hypothetical protein ABSF69_06800 [Polyangiaceae bacterium]|jgi:hypothetical protein
MRLVSGGSSLLIVLAACGGARKPAESADTSSLESNSSSAKDAPAAPETASAPPPSTTGSAASSAAPSAAAAVPESVHPAPAATGSVDGKPFAPKLAHVIGPLQKDGRILLSLDERTECSSPSDAKPDDASLTILVPWEDGYKVDLSALKRGTKKKPGEIAFSRVNEAGKKSLSATFKPSGRVTIVKAPREKDAIGKMKIDLQSGDYMLAGDLDVQVCVAPK